MIAGRRKPTVNAAGLTRRPAFELRLLGQYDLRFEGQSITPPSTAKARSLLAYLALRSGDPIRRETLMSEFWPEADATSARNNLKTTLSSIRRIFRDHDVDPDDVLTVTREVVRWLAPAQIDSRDFAACSIASEPERRSAIALYRGEFMPGDFNEWSNETRQALALQFESALRAEIAMAPLPATAERLLALDPYCDEAYVALVECALTDGNRRKALAIYHRYVAALAELGTEPPRDLAARVGARAAASVPAFAFIGRADALAEVGRLVAAGAEQIVVSGISGIGKSAFINHAHERFTNVRFVESHGGEGDIELGGLEHDEISLGIRRLHPNASAEVIDALWQRSNGLPAVLVALIDQLERFDIAEAAALARVRLPREVERRFDTMLHEAGPEVAAVAVLIALEPRLDNDDLAVLLDSDTARVLDARERLSIFGIAMPHVLEAALRTLSTSRRTDAIERIAQRLKLHEDPTERSDAARLLVQVGRRAEAAHAYLEAAQAFHATAAWENAIRTIDAGLSALELLPTSDAVTDIARELHLLKGRSLYQQGSFPAAIHALESVLEASDKSTHRAIRASALVLIGNALARMDAIEPAFEIAHQAVEEAPADSSEALAAHFLMARVLRDQVQYEPSIAVASRTYDRSMHAREWSTAVHCAHLVIDVSRRMLHIDTANAWANRMIDAGLLAGPLMEAEARHMFGALRAVINDLDGALEAYRYALALIEMHRRRRSSSASPLGQLEWMLHYSLAHTHVRTGNVDQAVAESEWLLRSPWMRNRPNCWQALSVAINARLAANTERDTAAARALAERMPQIETKDPRAALDQIARARLAARNEAPNAPRLLRAALTGLNELALIHADQVHPYYHLIAESARGIDNSLSARAASLARRFEGRLIEAAGPLWHSGT